MSDERCPIVELRRYALRPGAREALIELFDRELVETQEEVGMQILGQFRDLDDPDSFVWLRGFSDMESRKRGLEAFYSGPVWKEHGPAANATMVDSDKVLLLRAVADLELAGTSRPAPGSIDQPGLVVVTIYSLAGPDPSEFPAFFARELEPALGATGVSVRGTYATEHSPNTFPALPVREDENVFVWMTVHADEADHARHALALDRSPLWQNRISQALAERLHGGVETLRLRPTARSLLHG
jgi:quinol monooxygenase YgiN